MYQTNKILHWKYRTFLTFSSHLLRCCWRNKLTRNKKGFGRNYQYIDIARHISALHIRHTNPVQVQMDLQIKNLKDWRLFLNVYVQLNPHANNYNHKLRTGNRVKRLLLPFFASEVIFSWYIVTKTVDSRLEWQTTKFSFLLIIEVFG